MTQMADIHSVSFVFLNRTIKRSKATGVILDPDVTDSPWCVLQRHISTGNDGRVMSCTNSDLSTLKNVWFVKHGSDDDFLENLR